MSDFPLNPTLRQTAEQYLGRALEPQEAQQLLILQQNLQSQPAPPLNAVQQARQQAQQTIAQGQNRASSSVRDILASIQASSSKALQVQEAEEQAILKLLEGTQSLAELRPSTLQPGMNNLQAGSQLALSQIAEHLSNLARQEVEKCFNQYFGPLTEQLQDVVQKLQAQNVAPSANSAPAGVASATGSANMASPANPTIAPAATANNVHNPAPPPSMP